MSQYLKIITDLHEDSKSILNSIKSRSNSAAYTLNNKTAYEKNPSLMYWWIKSSSGDVSRAIENTAALKRAAHSMQMSDYNKLYNAPLLYQDVSGRVSATSKNNIVSGTMMLYNHNGYSSWDRKTIGIEARTKLTSKDGLQTKEEILTTSMFYMGIDSKAHISLDFSFDISAIAKKHTITEYEANIKLVPFVIFGENTLYFAGLTKELSCIRNDNSVYSDTKSFKVVSTSDNGAYITDYSHIDAKELTIPNVITEV